MPRRTLATLLSTVLLVGLVPFTTAATDGDGPLVFAPAGITTDRFPVATTPERVDVEAHDGILLHARVYRPDTSSDPSWRTPIILVHSPYYNGQVYGSPARSMDLVQRFTPKGYTVVLSDVRGTGNSGGCGEQDGINQQLDFATLVEHFAQQPWSNGRVGSYGKSYDAETQHAGAIHAPDGLVTMVSVAGISGLYDVAYYDGVPLRLNGLLSAAAYELYDLDVPSDASYLPRRTGRHRCQPANLVNGADPRGDMTPYWAEREFRTGVDRVEASTLYVMGLSDFIVSPIAIDGWYDELPTFKRAIFGQWAHRYPYDAPADWARDDWYDAVHAWFDHELLDLPTGIEAWPPVQVQSERNTWRAVASFAGMGTPRPLALSSTRVLSADPGPAGTVAFPEQGTAGWTSAPLWDDLHLSGQVELDATITLDRPDAHFVLELREVLPNRSSRLLTRGYLSAVHRASLETPEPVPLFEPLRYRIRSYPFDRTVGAGSSLQVVLRGYDGWTTPAATGFTARVATGEGGSVLHLPVVTAPCGVVVAQRTAPKAAVSSCPGGVPGD